MEMKNVALVIADISGYTEFIRKRRVSLLHAEELITMLLESVIETADFPLNLNKLEGDAAFFFAPFNDGQEIDAAEDVLRQVADFHEAFDGMQAHIVANNLCDCEACEKVKNLRLKSFVHLGQALFKTVRKHEELAGEDVILIHRLLKNTVPGNEYSLLTEPVWSRGDLEGWTKEEHSENVPDMGHMDLRLYRRPGRPKPLSAKRTFWGKMKQHARLEKHIILRMLHIKGKRR